MINGYFKVEEQRATNGMIIATMFNPITLDTYCGIARDVFGEVDDELINEPLDNDAWRMWRHSKGEIVEGDKVVIVKGRLLPKGTESYVEGVEPIYKNSKIVDYKIYLTNGSHTYKKNVELVA